METKTSKAVAYMRSGEWQKALSIFKTFRIGFTNEERRSIQIASEVLNGNGDFYRQIGIDTRLELEKTKTLLLERYPR